MPRTSLNTAPAITIPKPPQPAPPGQPLPASPVSAPAQGLRTLQEQANRELTVWAMSRLAFDDQPAVPAPLLEYCPRHQQLCEEFSLRAPEQLATAYQELVTGQTRSALWLDTLTGELRQLLALDRDATLARLHDLPPRYPYAHAVRTALFALALGRQLEVPGPALQALGIGCLVHDVGMLRLNAGLIQTPHFLNRLELLELSRHPIETDAIIRDVAEIPPDARLIAWQIHERADGSGYPNNRTLEQIHPLARIAAVADVYAALTAPRRHRTALSAHEAVQQILSGTRRHEFDPQCTRALVETLSLFPIGSRVELSDGRPATVLRSNGPRYTEPMLIRHEAGNRPLLINLLHEKHLHITRELPGTEPAA